MGVGPHTSTVSPASMRPAGRYQRPRQEGLASCIINTFPSLRTTPTTTYVTVLNRDSSSGGKAMCASVPLSRTSRCTGAAHKGNYMREHVTNIIVNR